MAKLKGKIAVVTGGNSGIGLATARLFAQEGAQVVITGRRMDALASASAAGDHALDPFQGDASNLADLDRLHDVVKERYGRIDVLFANAGISSMGTIDTVSEQQFDELFGVNVKGVFFTAQKLLPLMPDGASIILNSSIAAHRAGPGFSIYAASKAAVTTFARNWTADLRHRKIRVNAIAPGAIDTPIFSNGHTPDQSDGIKAFMATQVSLGRMGQPDEVARTALFFACDDSSFVTGIEVTVDGGLTAIS